MAPDNPARDAEYFYHSAQVFGTDTTVFRDLDLATVREGIAGPGSGLPKWIDYNGTSYCFAVEVSLEHTQEQGEVPWLAWLMDSPDDYPRVVARMQFGFPSGSGFQYKFPKVDAIYKQTVDWGDIIVAVSFMFRSTDEYETEWGLGIVFMHWSSEAFHNGNIGLYDASYYVLYKPWYMPKNPENANVWGHDLAFNPENGDLYVVYTNNEGGSADHPWKLNYFRISLDNPYFSWTRHGHWRAFTAGWSMNAWLPSVDVGVLTTCSTEPEWTVGVAFTAQNHPYATCATYNVAGNSWLAGADYDEDHDDTDYHVYVDPVQGSSYDCGLPELDIAYYANGVTPHPFYAIAYVEGKIDHTVAHRVYVLDSLVNVPWRVRINQNDAFEKILPSIATHIDSWNRRASVSYYVWDDDFYKYNPAAVRVNLSTTGNGNSCAEASTMVTFGYQGVYGPWNLPLAVTSMDSGIATDIVMQTGNYYYLAFANSVGTNTMPDRVYAAWGNTMD